MRGPHKPLCAENSPISSVPTKPAVPEFLQGWIEETCGVKEHAQTPADALHALGLQSIDDLRFLSDETIASLPGVPEVQKNKLRECMKRTRQEL